MRDQTLTKITALPAAAGTTNPTGVDLSVSPRTGPLDGHAMLRVTCPATPALTDATTITYSFEHSDSPSTGFALIPGVSTHVVTGAGGGGGAAVDELRHMPSVTKRYVRCRAVVQTGGGNNTGVSYTFSVDYHTVL